MEQNNQSTQDTPKVDDSAAVNSAVQPNANVENGTLDPKTTEAAKDETTVTKTDTTENPVTEDKPKEGAAAEVKYELKLPENSLLGEGKIAEIESYAKEHKLSNEQAQGLLERENKVLSDYNKSQADLLEKSRHDWHKQVLADKEIGGENLNKNVELAHRALEKFGSKELRDALEKTGLGNHPELVRAFYKVGKAMSEDSIIKSGNATSSNKKSMEDIFYNNK